MFANCNRSLKSVFGTALATSLFAGFSGVAQANDGAIQAIFEASNIDLTNGKKLLKKQSNGLRLSLSGSDTNEVSGIEKLVATYPDGKNQYLDTIDTLKKLYGQPVSGRGDLLVWTVNNPDASFTQSTETVIIAGTHGQDRHVISLNRQGKTRGNNYNAKRPVKTPPPATIDRPKKPRSTRAAPNAF